MSLDIDLAEIRYLNYDENNNHFYYANSLYYCNITHNLCQMAEQCGLYIAIWRPYMLIKGYDIDKDDYDAQYEFEAKNTIRAKEIIEILKNGLLQLKAKPKYFKKFDAPNGWGVYDDFVSFVERYLHACEKYPDSFIKVSR